jgi:hypothetical protein
MCLLVIQSLHWYNTVTGWPGSHKRTRAYFCETVWAKNGKGVAKCPATKNRKGPDYRRSNAVNDFTYFHLYTFKRDNQQEVFKVYHLKFISPIPSIYQQKKTTNKIKLFYKKDHKSISDCCHRQIKVVA